MTTVTAETLAAFLLARIAEDEAVARAARDDSAREAVSLRPIEGGQTAAALSVMEHLTRFNPARVLAECEAKRRIVELCAPGDWSAPHWRSYGEPGEDDRGDVLALIALPYVDHPDYREAWRP
jgi:hypothetical protein